jgi:hypothetical protein
MIFDTDKDVATCELLWSEIGCLAEVETDAMQRMQQAEERRIARGESLKGAVRSGFWSGALPNKVSFPAPRLTLRPGYLKSLLRRTSAHHIRVHRCTPQMIANLISA